MKNLVIGITFSLVTVFTIILVILSYREGELFVIKDVWSSLISRISNFDFITKTAFDRLVDSFKSISNFELPSFSDGPIAAIKSVFNLLGDIAVALFNVLGLGVGPLVDMGRLLAELLFAINDGWSEPVVPLIL